MLIADINSLEIAFLFVVVALFTVELHDAFESEAYFFLVFEM